MKSASKPINCCQICNSNKLESILFVGYMPPVNTMPSIGSMPVEEPSYPLELLRCNHCGLVQIGFEVAPDLLFPESYPYLSGTTKILKENFADLFEETNNLIDLDSQKMVVDIGSNDGTLLFNFSSKGFRVLGIEPSQAADVANKKGIKTLKTYFNLKIAKNVRLKYGKAQLISAANVFAHIGDIHSVVDGVVELLDDKGVFVTESHYLMDLVNTIQYDTIYHEHLRYYSLRSLMYLFSAHELEVFHVKLIPTHGGSIRVFAGRKGQHEISRSVDKQLFAEDTAGLTDGSLLHNFRHNVINSRNNLNKLIARIKKTDARIFGVGAPSRASTFINYCGIDDGVLEAIMEVPNSHKLNKYMPGTRIPVLDEKLIYEEQPDYALILSWHITDELVKNLKNNGYRGKFIIPLPEARIID
ncbi:class I SAM-dependent methyltransferase [Alphaproteobacteria bacterium]|nr:class I SAM-dependent methyltransferase [Alphaproteobacteria bacterium]